jgi:hypothetical protein
MAYDPTNLSALSYANGFTLWHYKTTDPASDVDTAGYFNGAAGMMRVGDFILANTGVGGAIQSGVFIVATTTPSSVDVSNLQPFGVSNAD